MNERRFTCYLCDAATSCPPSFAHDALGVNIDESRIVQPVCADCAVSDEHMLLDQPGRHIASNEAPAELLEAAIEFEQQRGGPR